jgi:uncharacterized protein
VGQDTPFDYLYWQFVADEMYVGDSVSKRKAVLVQLINKFFSRTDVLYPLIPLMGMVRNKLFPTRALELYASATQCRVSTHLFNVMPNGEIYPCHDCEAYAWCRGNCMNNMYLGYVKNDLRYRTNVLEPICDLIRFMGQEIDKRNPQAWFERARLPVRKQIMDCGHVLITSAMAKPVMCTRRLGFMEVFSRQVVAGATNLPV